MPAELAATLWRKAGEGARRFCAAVPEADLRQVPDGWLMVTGLHRLDLNISFIDAGATSDTLLREHVGVMRRRSLSGFVILTKAAETSLASLTRELGLVFGGPARLMAWTTSSGSDLATPFQIEVVRDHAGLETYTEIMAAAYQIPAAILRQFVTDRTISDPAILHLIAWRDREPYSVGSTVQTGSSVGVWNMGTPAEKQRQGAGRAVLDYAIRLHISAGRRLFYLLATEEGRHLYEQVGFRVIDEASTYLVDPA